MIKYCILLIMFTRSDKKVIYGIESASSLVVSFVFSVPFGETISYKFLNLLGEEINIVNNTLPYLIWAPIGASLGVSLAGNILDQVGAKFDDIHKIAFIGGVAGFVLFASISAIYSFINKDNPLNGFTVGAKIGSIVGSSVGAIIGYNK